MLSRNFATLFLFLSGAGISDYALSAGGGNDSIESNISDIVLAGPQALLPGFEGEYVLSWAGGQAPFTVVVASEPCPEGINNCAPEVTVYEAIPLVQERQIAFDASFQDPQIARLVGTVIDADGMAATSAPLNVRAGTDSRYFISYYDYIDFNAEGCFESRIFSPGSVGEFDPNEAFIRITDETAVGFPVFSWDSFSNPSVVASDSIAISFEVKAGTFNPLFGLVDEQGGEPGILPPLAYGDYSRPGTVPFDPFELLPIPAPPLPTDEGMSAKVLTEGGGCPRSRPGLSFALNPPEAGSPVLLQGPAEDLDMQDPDPTLAELLNRGRRISLSSDQAAIAGCVNEGLSFSAIAVIATRLNTQSPISVDQITFDILTNTQIVDDLIRTCAATVTRQAGANRGAAARTKGPAPTPDFDLEVVSGSGRVTLPDATTVSEIRTAHARVIVSGGALAIDIAQTADGQSSTIGSQDSSLLVMPNNPALPETSVPAGFFVILSDTSISTPNEFAMFVDGFE